MRFAIILCKYVSLECGLKRRETLCIVLCVLIDEFEICLKSLDFSCRKCFRILENKSDRLFVQLLVAVGFESLVNFRLTILFWIGVGIG